MDSEVKVVAIIAITILLFMAIVVPGCNKAYQIKTDFKVKCIELSNNVDACSLSAKGE